MLYNTDENTLNQYILNSPGYAPGQGYWTSGDTGEWIPFQQTIPQDPAPTPQTAPTPPPVAPSQAQGPTLQSQMFNPTGPIYQDNPLYTGMGYGLGFGQSPFGEQFGDYGAPMPWGMYSRPYYDPSTGQFQNPLIPGTPYADWAMMPNFNPALGGYLPDPLQLYGELERLNPRVGQGTGIVKK